MIYLVDKKRQGEFFLPLLPDALIPRLTEELVFLVGCVENETPIGAALLEVQGEQVQLLSIAVDPPQRRRGVGTAIMERCVALLQATCTQTFYAVLPAELPELAAFFSSLPWFCPQEGASGFSIPLGKLLRIPLLQGPAPGAVSVEDVPSAVYLAYQRNTFPADTSQCSRTQLDQHVSQVMLQDGRVSASALFSPSADGLSLDWLHNRSSDKLAPLLLLRAALAAMAERCSPETVVSFVNDSEIALRLAEKLLGVSEKHETVLRWEISAYALMEFEAASAYGGENA